MDDSTPTDPTGWPWVDNHPGRLHQLLERISLRAAYVDHDGVSRYRNRAMQEWLGRADDDRAELHVRDLLGAQAYESVENRMRAALDGVAQVFERPGPGGAEAPTREETTYLPVSVSDESSGGVLVTIGDATRRASGESTRAQALIRSALLEERTRLAMLMHDDVLQGLFSVALDLDQLTDLSPKSAERVEAAHRTLRAAIESLRGTIDQISRGGGRSSPVSGVEQLVSTTVAHAGLDASIRHLGAFDDLPERITEQLLTVLAEALMNVVTHAGATAVTVTVASDVDELVMMVTDNGVGRELTRTSSPKDELPSGRLTQLARQARDLGGELTTADNEPAGTVLTWRVPLD